MKKDLVWRIVVSVILVGVTPVVLIIAALLAVFVSAESEKLGIGMGAILVAATTVLLGSVCFGWTVVILNAGKLTGAIRKVLYIFAGILSAGFAYIVCIRPLVINDRDSFDEGTAEVESVKCNAYLPGDYQSGSHTWPLHESYGTPFNLYVSVNFGGRPDVTEITIEKVVVSSVGKVPEDKEPNGESTRAAIKRKSWSADFSSKKLRVPYEDCDVVVVMKWTTKKGEMFTRTANIRMIHRHRSFLSNAVFEAMMSA